MAPNVRADEVEHLLFRASSARADSQFEWPV
jgi:hypothetical protein